MCFFFNDTATTEIYTLSLHDALPICMKGAPQTPQTKMIGYMMPAMMTVLFWNFPSGLNLYYGVQNVVALPQQWLLTRERAKAAGAQGAANAPAPASTPKTPKAAKAPGAAKAR